MADADAHKGAPKKKPAWHKAFLAALAETANVQEACRAARVGRRTVYTSRERDGVFAAAWEEAIEQAADVLEREAIRRAREGLVRYKFGKDGEALKHPVTGEPYYELEYSDTLLIFLLKGARPHKYRDNVRQEHVGPGGGPVRVEHDLSELRKLPPDELLRLHREGLGLNGEAGKGP